MTPSASMNAAQIAATFASKQAPPPGAYDINSLIAGMVDRGAYKYYDTLNTAAGATLNTSYQFFAVPAGAIDPVTTTQKTLLQTNMQRGNNFPPPRCLVLMQLGILFSNMLLADIQLFLQNYYMQFVIDSKLFFEGRMEFYPCGYGVFGSSQNSGESVWGLGFPAPQATVRYMQYAKYIAPLQQFSWTLQTFSAAPTLAVAGVGGKGANIVFFMDGVTDRAVQ